MEKEDESKVLLVLAEITMQRQRAEREILNAKLSRPELNKVQGEVSAYNFAETHVKDLAKELGIIKKEE